jgi:hypothetical protein
VHKPRGEPTSGAPGRPRRDADPPANAFVGRFLQHVLPRHFTRLRSYGFLANTKKRERLAAIRAVLKETTPPSPSRESACGCPTCGVGLLVEYRRVAPFTLRPLDSS